MPLSGSNVVKHISTLLWENGLSLRKCLFCPVCRFTLFTKEASHLLHLWDLYLHWVWKPPRLLCPLITSLTQIKWKEATPLQQQQQHKTNEMHMCWVPGPGPYCPSSVNLLNSPEKLTQLGSPSHGRTEAQRSNLYTEPLSLQKATYLI